MANKPGDVQIIHPDPLHPVTGLLVPFLLQRMLDFAKIHYEELLPEAQVREFGARMMLNDHNQLVQAFVTPDGRLIGHAISHIQEFGGKSWLYVAQCKLDEPGADIISRAIEEAERFAQERGATLLLFATKRSDSSWQRAYGFKTARHIMMKPLGNGAKESVKIGRGDGREG